MFGWRQRTISSSSRRHSAFACFGIPLCDTLAAAGVILQRTLRTMPNEPCPSTLSSSLRFSRSSILISSSCSSCDSREPSSMVMPSVELSDLALEEEFFGLCRRGIGKTKPPSAPEGAGADRVGASCSCERSTPAGRQCAR